MADKNQKKNRDRIGYALYFYYLLMLLAGVIFCVRFFYIATIWKPDDKIASRLTQPVRKKVLEPTRGSILAEDGRPLAMSYPRYQIYIDCNARKGEFELLSKKDRADSIETWKRNAAVLAEGLSEAFGTQTPEYYKNLLYKNHDKGSRYLKLGKPIEKDALLKLQTYPLFNQGKNKGGVWAESVPTRRYPYGGLARRTIGSVTENEESSFYSGIDGKYNHVLHGSSGQFYIKQTDNGFIRDYDSLYVKAVDGNDVRTTINLDYQDIADRALRKYVEPEEDLEAACFILMESKTGAIKAMVNLEKDAKGKFGENNNVAVMRRGEPGSVFKIVTLMTCIEDGIVSSADQTIPGNHGEFKVGNSKFPTDKHLKDYEREFHTTNIPLWYCVQVSSNNAFRYLAVTNYKDKPVDFVGRLHTYNLGKSFDFDVYEGITPASIKDLSRSASPTTDLAQIAMGYGVSVTPMHILTFYNAIACKGRMMKPYLVEDIEKDGKVIEKLGPSVLNASICRPETAELLTEMLCSVTEMGTAAGRGTGWRLSKAKCKVAGKTGTADIFTDGKYVVDGKRYQQGTFAGFFPAEDPKYTVVCVVWSKLSKKEFAGGVIPASTVRDFINEIYNIDPYWNETISNR